MVLTAARWNDHIRLDHGEMATKLDLIELAVREPDVINYDVSLMHRENFYLLEVTGSQGNRHVKVCVEFGTDPETGAEIGEVITAYVTHSVKTKEVPKWRR